MCAENTGQCDSGGVRPWNYLRVRGEYGIISVLVSSSVELPPRARRIPMIEALTRDDVGTTSACAENTHKTIDPMLAPWNYLRVRGEYTAPYG